MNDDTFISGSRDQQIIVWKNYKVANRIRIHHALVLSLCRINNTMFASGSGDNTIHIANLDGKILKTLVEHTNWVWQVIKLDGSTIASCSEDNSIKIWDIITGASLATFTENNPIISMAFNNHTRQLISGNLTGEISVRTLNDQYEQQNLYTIPAHTGIIRTIKFINKDTIATGGEDNTIKIWRLNGQLLAELKHQNFVQSIELLNNHTLLSASYDGTIKSWAI